MEGSTAVAPSLGFLTPGRANTLRKIQRRKISKNPNHLLDSRYPILVIPMGMGNTKFWCSLFYQALMIGIHIFAFFNPFCDCHESQNRNHWITPYSVLEALKWSAFETNPSRRRACLASMDRVGRRYSFVLRRRDTVEYHPLFNNYLLLIPDLPFTSNLRAKEDTKRTSYCVKRMIFISISRDKFE